MSDEQTLQKAEPKAPKPAGPLIEGGRIRGRRPADGEPLPEVEVTPTSELPALVERCRAAQRKHAARDLEERAALLRRFKNALLRSGERLAKTICAETGKPEVEAWLHEVVPTADLGDYWASEGPSHLAAVEPHLDMLSYPGKRAVVERVARGVVGVITPWNFPVALPLRTLFPALLAGDGVVLKPSEHTPRTAQIIADVAAEIFGEDLVVVVQGGGDVGAALVASGVDAVIFTGSVVTGRKVAHAAADALIPVSLELGGKDAAIVLEDANLERAARGLVWGGFMNAGQNCASVERVYATAAVAKPLRERMVALSREIVVGRDLGPLTTEAQLAVVERQVQAAKSAGAEVVAGGERADQPGYWYPPTILTEAPAETAAMTEETFGPMIPVIEVADEKAAIEAASTGRYGLTASVWTKDLVRGERIARLLPAGVVMINNHGFTGSIPSMPWTGVGDSGYGVTNSPHALDILTRPRALLVDMSRAKSEMWWYPYTPGLLKVARSMAILRGGGGFLDRVKAVFSLLGGFASRNKP